MKLEAQICPCSKAQWWATSLQSQFKRLNVAERFLKSLEVAYKIDAVNDLT